MADAEVALVAILTTGSPNAVAALVGVRVYPVVLPQNVTYPAIRYARISTAREQYRLLSRTVANKASRQDGRFQIDCYAVTDADARALAAAVRSELDGYSGTIAGLRIDRTSIDGEDGEIEPEVGDVQSPVYRRHMDFILSHAE